MVPWRAFRDTALTDLDFDQRLDQRLGDLSDSHAFNAEAEVLSLADLVLLHGPKDGRSEPAFLELYLPLLRERQTVLVIDDIRFINMIQIWRDLPLPKLDVTSFGHWTGTGLVVAP